MPVVPEAGSPDGSRHEQASFGSEAPEILDRPGLPNEIERRYLLDTPEDMKRLEALLQAKYPDAQMVAAYYEYSYIYPDLDRDQLLQLAGFLREEDFIQRVEQIPPGVTVSLTIKEWENRESGGLYANIKASADPLGDQQRIEIPIQPTEMRTEDLIRLSGLGQPDTIWEAEPRRRWQIEPGTVVDVMLNSGYGCSAEIESASVERIEQLEIELGGDTPLTALSDGVKRAAYEEYKAAGFSFEGERGWGDRTFTAEQWATISGRAHDKPVRNRIAT